MIKKEVFPEMIIEQFGKQAVEMNNEELEEVIKWLEEK